MVVVVSRYSGVGFFLERVLGVVLCDDNGVSPHQHVSWVVLIRTPRVIGFYFFFLLGVYLRDFAVHSDGVSPTDVGVIFLLLFWTVYCHVLIIIIIIILCVIVLYSYSLLYTRIIMRTWRD
jgi:hypothetical protein